MNLERLRWGEWIAAFAALDLLIVTFRAWYKVSGGGAHVTAWDALEQGRYLLIATAVVGIFLWLLKASDDPPRLSIPLGWIAAAVGFACTVYVAYRLATPPSDNLDPDIGLYLGLASALGVTIGGLLSARDEAAEPGYSFDEGPAAPGTATATESNALVPDSGNTWSPANPSPSTSGWSPAAAPAALPPAATAAAVEAGAGRALQSGDSVVLTAGGARFPAGTVAEVVEVFGGGALVEVKAADGMAERFEVPESAYDRAPAGGAPVGADEWSPAMPAPAGEDWGFDEPSAGSPDTPDMATTEAPNGDAEASAEKVPWWKREIGGGKKKKDEAIEAGAVGGAAAGAAAIAAESNGSGQEKPGFFKRLFGGGADKADEQTETLEGEPTPATDVAGLGQAAESDTAVDEPIAESAVDEPIGESAVDEPAADSAADARAADTAVDEHEADPDIASAAAASSEPPAAAAPAAEAEVAEPAASEPGPDPVAEPDPPAAPEPELIASEPVEAPEPAASEPVEAPEPAVSDPEPEPAASEPGVAASEPEPATPEPEPDPEPSAAAAEDSVPNPEPPAADASAAETEVPAAEAAGAGAAAGAAASAAGDADEEPKPTRRRSSGSRKVPKEALAAAAGEEAQPKVGDEVQLKVGGGRYDAGTRGTVVDVFSAGVIVELSDDAGRTERLDLPFEAIGPADA